MQIHELTKKKQFELEEGIIDTVKSGIAGARQGYQTSKTNRSVSELAEKAFRTWQTYVAQLEQSIAKQPGPAVAPASGAAKANATKDTAASGAPTTTPATTPPANGATSAPTTTQSADATARGEQNKGFGFNRDTGVAFTSQAEKDAFKAQAGSAPATTTPPATAATKPNYGTQTGAGAKVTYNQPTGIPNPLAKTPQATSKNMMEPPANTPATVASTAPGQTITVGGQKIKPGQPGYDQLAKATLKELQAPVSPALQAFRDRTDGKYEAYLKAFVQKNLLSGLGFRGLVNQQEIDNAIKAIAAPENANPAKQRPLWDDLARATMLAVPAAGALTGRDPRAPKDPNAPSTTTTGTTAPGNEPVAGEEQPEEPTQAEPAKPGMTKAQISQWISRNSEDPAALKAALDAINAVKA